MNQVHKNYQEHNLKNNTAYNQLITQSEQFTKQTNIQWNFNNT